jgi:hypothetical protein
MIEKITSFSSLIGVVDDYERGQLFRSYYPVLSFHGYDGRTNTINFSAPYFVTLIIKMLKASIKKDNSGKPLLDKNAEPILLPCHSYLIDSKIVKVRNKKAAEIVFVVVSLVERSGNNTPHKKARAIVDECPTLKQALTDATDASYKNKILKRAFTTAWELLPKYTKLGEKYSNFTFPSEVPSMSTLDTMVFSFPHGRARKWDAKSP